MTMTLSSGALALRISGAIILVGAGKMGGAMLEGWLALGLDPHRVIVIDPQPSAEIAGLAERGVRINPTAESIQDVVAIVIAVKPQVAPAVMPTVARYLGPATVVISIMAGRPLSFLRSALNRNAALVRAMPNTPAAIGRGITVAVPSRDVTAVQRE